jgi:hypothetical protein
MAAKEAAAEADSKTVGFQATVGGDEVKGLCGAVRGTGLAPPKRLTTKQRRIVGALVGRGVHSFTLELNLSNSRTRS